MTLAYSDTSTKASSVALPFPALRRRATSCHQNRRAALRTASKLALRQPSRARPRAAERNKRDQKA